MIIYAVLSHLDFVAKFAVKKSENLIYIIVVFNSNNFVPVLDNFAP